jgi:hypothetical protein
MKDLTDYNSIVSQIKELLVKSRSLIAREINNTHLKTYWEIGRIIIEYEQKGNIKAEYGRKVLPEISRRLTRELGLAFPVQTSKAYGISTLNTQFARHCLANYHGLIIANYY